MEDSRALGVVEVDAGSPETALMLANTGARGKGRREIPEEKPKPPPAG